MLIQDKHYYHGAALTQIVEAPSFKALNKVDKKYGHYSINNNIRLLMKHSSSEGPSWSYTLSPSETKAIQKDIEAGFSTYLCLICGLTSICLLGKDQIKTLINLVASSSQTIQVEQHKGGSLWAFGSKGNCNRAIPHNAFPRRIFS